MHTTQQLREQRANVFEQMKEVRDFAASEKRLMNAEETAKYDRMDAEYERLDQEIDRAEKMEAREVSLARRGTEFQDAAPGLEPKDDDAELDRIFDQFLRKGLNRLAPEDRAVMEQRMVNDDKIQNAAGVGTGAGGGFAVAPAFRDVFIETLKWYGPMVQEAESFSTSTGANIPWPTNDDTGNVGAILGENVQVSEQDVTLGQTSLDAYMYTSKLVRVSFQLLNDRPDFDTWLARKLGERIGRILNQHFTTGTGTAQPDGIVTSATVGVTGSGSFATTGGISFDNVIDLTESLDPAYGGLGDLKFMGHQSVRKALRKVKDTQNRYIWEPSVQAGKPSMVYGYEFLLNNDMAALAVNSKSLGFGSIRQAYVVRTVQDLTTLRLTERYADFLQVGFLAFYRGDGTLQDANAFKTFQTTATA